MNRRCCRFMGVWKCVSGERLVHICDFQWKALKSNMSSRHSPEPYFQLSHTHATLKLVLWLKYFFKSVTLVQCFCADWLETTRETHEIVNFLLRTACVSYFCHVFTQRAACQFVFLVESAPSRVCWAIRYFDDIAPGNVAWSNPIYGTI